MLREYPQRGIVYCGHQRVCLRSAALNHLNTEPDGFFTDSLFAKGKKPKTSLDFLDSDSDCCAIGLKLINSRVYQSR
uniref:Uncharacterized protein n=1 Tax=Pararge aegeria TaxID=116150 RepID=S4PC74_9NEOP